MVLPASQKRFFRSGEAQRLLRSLTQSKGFSIYLRNYLVTISITNDLFNLEISSLHISHKCRNVMSQSAFVMAQFLSSGQQQLTTLLPFDNDTLLGAFLQDRSILYIFLYSNLDNRNDTYSVEV